MESYGELKIKSLFFIEKHSKRQLNYHFGISSIKSCKLIDRTHRIVDRTFVY